MLELYALGILSEAEEREVEQQLAFSEELRVELAAIQNALGQFGVAQAKKAPKSALEGALYEIQTIKSAEQTSAEPAASLQEPTPEPVIVEKIVTRKGRRVWPIAASVLLAVSVGGNAYLFTNWQSANKLVQVLQEQQFSLANNETELKGQLASLESNLNILQNKTNIEIPLGGLTNYPNASAVVYWEPSSKQVYILPKGLPTPPSDLQYQLWAVNDGVVLDAGVFDVSEDSAELQKVKVIESAQTFIVTLERKGGVPVAEGEAYVAGDVQA